MFREKTVKKEFKSSSRKRKLAQINNTHKHVKTLTEFVQQRRGSSTIPIYPFSCCCNNESNRPRIAFADDTDEHKVEAGLYSGIIQPNEHVSSSSSFYQTYGDCVFCESSLWLLMFLSKTYNQEMEEEKNKQTNELSQ